MFIMKTMKTWWEFNFFWLLMFAIGIFWLSVRKVDAAGVVQTPQTRLVSLLILMAVLVLIVICQTVIYLSLKKSSK